MSDQSRDEEITPERSAELRDAVRRGMAELFANTEKSINTPLTVQEITSLPDAELDDRVWLRLTSLVDCSDPARLAAEDPDVSAYLATRAFEWEVGNGGRHQYWTLTDGRRLEVNGCDFLTVRNGKIIKKNSYRKQRPSVHVPAHRPQN